MRCAISWFEEIQAIKRSWRNGVCFAVMELLEGETLRSLINQGPLPWGRALEIATAVAEGLSAAHSKGVIHRDLNSSNVLIAEGYIAKLSDFGLAKISNSDSSSSSKKLGTIR